MRARTGSGLGGHALLLLAVCGLAAVLAPASCTLDVQGTGPDAPGTGGTGPGSGGMGPGVGGSTTSSSSGGSGGSGGQGGVTPPPPEDCLDGNDNDMDGLVDCADVDDCAPADYECAPEPPAGWTGLVRAVTVAEGEVLPDCPAGMTQADYHAGPVEASCTACSCDWDGAQADCSTPEVTCWFGNNGCAIVNPDVYAATSNGTCYSSSNLSGFGSCRITAPPAVLNPGTCAVNGGGGVLADTALWTDAVRVCAADVAGKGCAGGEVCLPRPAPTTPALGETVCITREGTDACPDGWLDVDTQLYTSGTEARSCSACTCDTATVGCTGGSATAYDYADCSAGGGSTNLDGNCSNMDFYIDGTFSFRTFSATPTAPTCAGGEPMGAVLTDGPVKLCCRQQP